MLTLAQTILLAGAPYKQGDDHQSIIENLATEGWEFKYQAVGDEGVLSSTLHGYQGKVFLKDNVLAICHRGTARPSKLKDLNLRMTGWSSSNIKDDKTLVSGHLPFETQYALEFTWSVLGKLAEQHHDISQLQVIHIGHSLGAAYAHICAETNHETWPDTHKPYAVGVDSPGVGKLPLTITAPKRHINIQSEPNLVNQFSDKVGITYYLQEKSDYQFWELFKNVFKTHSLSYLRDKVASLSTEQQQIDILTTEPEALIACGFKYQFLERDPGELIINFNRPVPDAATRFSSSTHHSAGRVSLDNWMVAHVGNHRGHAMIIVEGLKLENPEDPQSIVPFVNYYHIVVPVKDADAHEPLTAEEAEQQQGIRQNQAIVMIEPANFHTYYSKYAKWEMLLYPCKSDDVKKMIAEIEQSKDDPVPYHILGKKSLFNLEGAHNCESWVAEKLETAGISVEEQHSKKANLKDNIAQKPPAKPEFALGLR